MGSVRHVKTAKYGYIIISLVLCVVGIILFMVPELPLDTVYYLLGILLIAYGIIRIIGYCSKDLYRLAFQFDLAFGILMILFGIMMIFQKNEMEKMLYISFGILILTDSLFKLQIAIDTKRFGMKRWVVVLILGIVSSIFGMLLLIRPIREAEAELICFGLALFFEGIMSLGVAISVIKISDYQIFDAEREDKYL